MPRLPVRIVTVAELQEVFNNLGLWDQIHSGALTSDPVPRSVIPAKNPRYAGGISRMLIHRNATGRHVCTTHQISLPNGTVLHWDEADVYLDEEILVKKHG